MLRERLSGPVSETERLGLGLSAAALASLAGLDERSSDDGEAEGEFGPHRHDDPEGAGEVFAALKSAAMGRAANKHPLAATPVGTTNASLAIGEDDAFSNPVSNRTDNGFGARRAAPRGSGSPLEGRVGGGTERSSDVTVLRKVEPAPGEARAPLPAAEGTAALRGAFGAEVATVAIAMAADLPEVRGERHQGEAKGANGAAAKANQGQAQAEASSGHAKAKDAPPPAEARAEQRQGPAPEAAGRDKAGDAPVAVEARVVADQGRAGAAEAPSRAKANDAAAAAAVSEAGADRKGGAAEAHGPAKIEGAPLAQDAKAGAARHAAETPEQALAKSIPATAGPEADRGHGPALAEAPGQAKGTPLAAIAEKAAVGAHGPAAPPVQAVKAADLPAAGVKAGQALDGTAEALTQGKKVIPAFGETKADPAHQQANAKDVGAAGAKADPGPGHSSAFGNAGDGGNFSSAFGNAGNFSSAFGNAGNGGAGGDARAPGQAKATDLPVAADAKASPALLGGPADTLANQAKAKDVPVITEAKAAPAAAAPADAKAEQATPPAAPPGRAKQADLPPAEKHKSAQHGDDADGAPISVALPADDTLNFHAPDLWRGAEKQSENGRGYVPSTEKAAPPVLHVTATDLVGPADGERSKAAPPSAGGGSPGDGTLSFFPLGSGEKGAAADALGQAAPDSAAGKGGRFLAGFQGRRCGPGRDESARGGEGRAGPRGGAVRRCRRPRRAHHPRRAGEGGGSGALWARGVCRAPRGGSRRCRAPHQPDGGQGFCPGVPGSARPGAGRRSAPPRGARPGVFLKREGVGAPETVRGRDCDGVDAPRRHLGAKVALSDHQRRRPSPHHG